MEYFEKHGKENTDELLDIVKEKLLNSIIKYVAIASISVETVFKLFDVLNEVGLSDKIIMVNTAHHLDLKKKSIRIKFKNERKT